MEGMMIASYAISSIKHGWPYVSLYKIIVDIVFEHIHNTQKYIMFPMIKPYMEQVLVPL